MAIVPQQLPSLVAYLAFVMASSPENPQQIRKPLPQVLLLRNPLPFSLIDKPLPEHLFQFLKPWESPLPLDQFVLANAQSARALLTSGGAPVTADLIGMLPELQLVLTTSAGLNHVDLSECRRRGIAVADAAGMFSEDVAEVAVGLLLDVWRRISAADRYVRAGRWVGHGDFPLGFKVSFLSLCMCACVCLFVCLCSSPSPSIHRSLSLSLSLPRSLPPPPSPLSHPPPPSRTSFLVIWLRLFVLCLY